MWCSTNITDMDNGDVKHNGDDTDQTVSISSKLKKKRQEGRSVWELRQANWKDLSDTDRKKVTAARKWDLVKNKIRTPQELTRVGTCTKDRKGNTWAEDGHQTIAGETHFWCLKCNCFCKFPPCCYNVDRSQLCPAGSLMSDAVLKKRNDQIESWLEKIQVGIYPEWRTVTMERQPELGDDDFELWEQEADYKTDYQDLQLVGTVTARDSAEMDLENGSATQKTYSGEVKPLTESLDVLSILPRGTSSAFQPAIREMEAAGEVVVPLEPSVDGLDHVGLPLDTAVEKMINTRLRELRAYWSNPETDITHLPPSEKLVMDASPYEAQDTLLPLLPLQFPTTANVNIRTAAFRRENPLRVTQQDLAMIEELIKLSIYSISNCKKMYLWARNKREQDQLQKTKENLEAAADETTEKPTKKRTRSQARKTDSKNTTPLEPDVTLAPVDAAIELALKDAMTGAVDALVGVVIARRRPLVKSGVSRQECNEILTRSITNTYRLA